MKKIINKLFSENGEIEIVIDKNPITFVSPRSTKKLKDFTIYGYKTGYGVAKFINPYEKETNSKT